jgi:DNA replication regulator SLD3
VRKTSLAYFTKSALSRARAEAKQQPGQSSLIPLLQGLLLQDEDFNTKYETYLPSLLVADLQNPPSSFLLQDELPHLTKRFGSGGDDEMRTRLLEIEIKELKVREYEHFQTVLIYRTQLQIILLSELLALDEESHGIENGLDDTERDDYETLLATHLDRLSIMAMLENSDDISEQFMREILLPLYVPSFATLTIVILRVCLES